jgi:hypothetical protein
MLRQFFLCPEVFELTFIILVFLDNFGIYSIFELHNIIQHSMKEELLYQVMQLVF